MNKTSIKFLSVLTSVLLTLAIIILSVKITLNFTPLYSFDIKHLSLSKAVELPESRIKMNYMAIINYLNYKKIDTLIIPDFEMSPSGAVHFEEVKQIFMTLDNILYFCFAAGIVFSVILIKNKSFSFLKHTSITLIIIPLLLVIPSLINFSATFDWFHMILFRNNFWEFNPSTDPVINILPEEYFFHCALLIMSLIVISSIALYIIYNIKKRRNSLHVN